MAEDKYSRARATREETSGSEREYGGYMSKRSKRKLFNKIKKSALLIVIAVTLVIGVVGGFLLNKYTSNFEMLWFKVNGVESQENDYVIVDVSQIRENLESTKTTPVTMEDVYEAVNLEDGGVVCKFLGMDVSNSIEKTYYYREDISHDAKEVTGINVEIPGVYYVVYNSDHFAFKKTTLIRTIIVTGVELDG